MAKEGMRVSSLMRGQLVDSATKEVVGDTLPAAQKIIELKKNTTQGDLNEEK